MAVAWKDVSFWGMQRFDLLVSTVSTQPSRRIFRVYFAAYISYICVLISIINDLNYPNRLSISTPNVSAASHLQWLWQMDDGGLNGDVYMNTDSAPSFSAWSHAAAWKEGPSGESNASSSADQGQLGLRHWRRLRHGQESRRNRAKVMCKANSSKRLLPTTARTVCATPFYV